MGYSKNPVVIITFPIKQPQLVAYPFFRHIHIYCIFLLVTYILSRVFLLVDLETLFE